MLFSLTHKSSDDIIVNDIVKDIITERIKKTCSSGRPETNSEYQIESDPDGRTTIFWSKSEKEQMSWKN